ncbi:hypothetical protein D9M71_128320 [compost metagenome]
MHFLVSSELLNSDNEVKLYDLAKRFLEERIFVEFSDIDRAEGWVETLDARTQETWTRVLRHSVHLKSHHNMKKLYLAANKVRVCHDIAESVWDGQVTLTLDDACMVLDHVTIIGLENSRNDRDFLLTLLSPRSRDRFLKLFQKGRLAFVGGGGNGELKVQLIERVVIPSFRLLSWIMFDNDACYPGHVPQATRDLIQVCRDNNLTFHCLERRCVENYITREIYNLAYPGVEGQKVDSIFGLSFEQSKYFNFKKGFSNSKEDDHAVYANLTKDQKKALGRGFGDKLAPEVYRAEHQQRIHEIFSASNVMAEFGNKLSHLEQLLGRPV